MKRDYHAAACHASYLTRYTAMAAGSERANGFSAAWDALAIRELEGLVQALGYDLVKREAAKVEEVV